MVRRRDSGETEPNQQVGDRGGSTERSDNREGDIRHQGQTMHDRQADPYQVDELGEDPAATEEGFIRDAEPGAGEDFSTFMLRRCCD